MGMIETANAEGKCALLTELLNLKLVLELYSY